MDIGNSRVSAGKIIELNICVMFSLYYEYLDWVFCYTFDTNINFTLEQAMNAQKWSIAVLFL